MAANIERASPTPGGPHMSVVLITGCSTGIGRELALTLASHGVTCVLLARSIPKLKAVYDEIVAAGGPCPSYYTIQSRIKVEDCRCVS